MNFFLCTSILHKTCYIIKLSYLIDCNSLCLHNFILFHIYIRQFIRRLKIFRSQLVLYAKLQVNNAVIGGKLFKISSSREPGQTRAAYKVQRFQQPPPKALPHVTRFKYLLYESTTPCVSFTHSYYWEPYNQTGKTNANPRYISVENYGYCYPKAAKSDYPVELKTNVFTYAIEMLGDILIICVFICLTLLLFYKIMDNLVFPRGVLLNYPDLLEKVYTSLKSGFNIILRPTLKNAFLESFCRFCLFKIQIGIESPIKHVTLLLKDKKWMRSKYCSVKNGSMKVHLYVSYVQKIKFVILFLEISSFTA